MLKEEYPFWAILRQAVGEKMRLFVAAELPEEVLEALAETSSMLRASVRGRYVSPDSFHVTLAFLGQVDAYRVNDAADAIEAGCRDIAPFSVSLGDLGKFGRRSSATLWQGFAACDDFGKLAEAVRDDLDRAGFEFDRKSFLPHVTLMRAADLSAGTLPQPACASGDVTCVSLFKSDLSGARPRYEALHTVDL